MSDTRPWRQIRLRLPEDVAVYLEKAFELARICGLAGNNIQAIEAMAVEFCQTYDLEQYRPEPQQVERYNKFKEKELSGFRCIRCEHSTSLHVHHIVPKSYYGAERPADINGLDNLACICASCHDHIHGNGWKHFVDSLKEQRAEAHAQVERLGHRVTRKHGDRSSWLES